MGNIEFDKRVRDLMEGHSEIPDAGSWERISSSLARRKRAKVLFMRRTIFATTAVAASLALLFFLDGGEMTAPQKSIIPDKLITEATQPSVTTQPSATTSSKEIHKADKISAKSTVTDLTTNIPEKDETKVVNTETNVIKGETNVIKGETNVIKGETKVIKDETKVVNDEAKVINEQQKPVKGTSQANNSGKTSEVKKRDYLFDLSRKSSRRKTQAPLLALSTNISPSTASNSVTLMGLSQSQSEFVVSNVVSTIQKAYVPQEVVSNTKFLMPISLGVQFQYPLTKKLYTATGLNYTLLFSHYDAISREQTRETQLTLHYIGIPLNLYYNLFNKESLRVYVSGGVAVEKGLYAYYKVFEDGTRKSYGQSIDGLQWSMNGGLGAEFQVNRSAGIYFDPSIAYYFDNNQPISIRSSQPLQFKFELGFRFHL
jgi:hypothetical protein